jgi:hypothetical protein
MVRESSDALHVVLSGGARALDAAAAAPAQLALCRLIKAALVINARDHRGVAGCAAARVHPFNMLPQLCGVIHSTCASAGASRDVLAEALSVLHSVAAEAQRWRRARQYAIVGAVRRTPTRE